MSEISSLRWKDWFESQQFADEYTYTGPLGPEYTPECTTLRLWAPTAEKVSVLLYRNGQGALCEETVPMVRGQQGVWLCELEGDQSGRYYTFAVTVDGIERETVDPYARAAGVNGLRGMILSPDAATPEGWEKDKRPEIPASRRVVWEVSVRDFSADPSSGVPLNHRGKYLAFTHDDTTVNKEGRYPTCLNYLKKMGITYVQLMPIYDFGSVNEERPSPSRYNWGYDPINYNVPEGSYATDPYRGEVRVQELKKMIHSLHEAGIGVIMDVVYNHMYHWENPLNDTVPYYFFRQNPDGSPSNGSGCGNETATERAMCRRYIMDSLVYWASEYHLDGFRFDLMGLIDVDTMNAARAALDALPGGESILMYGEPWQGGASAMKGMASDKGNVYLLDDRIGVFSDGTRDAIKGSCFDAREPGYVSGRWDSRFGVGAGVAAWCRSNAFCPKNPGQVVSYVSAHDNYTLWDKLLRVASQTPDYQNRNEAVLAQNRLCAGIYLTSLGIPFMLSGEEFARTKWGEHNSYNSDLSINRLDWNRVREFRDLVSYYQGLLGLRARFPRLSAWDTCTPNAIEFLKVQEPMVAWTLSAAEGDASPWGAIAVYYNPLQKECSANLPAGEWQLLCSGTDSTLWRHLAPTVQGQVQVTPVSVMVYGRKR